MRMDLFLHSHVDDICDAIWTRALKQYTSPYMSVDFAKMSKALHTPVPELEKSVAKLIVDGQISARIDSANKILYAKRGNARQTAFNKAVESGRRVVLSTEDQLRRLGMVQSNFEYRVWPFSDFPPTKPLYSIPFPKIPKGWTECEKAVFKEKRSGEDVIEEQPNTIKSNILTTIPNVP